MKKKVLAHYLCPQLPGPRWSWWTGRTHLSQVCRSGYWARSRIGVRPNQRFYLRARRSDWRDPL